jgi:DNA replication protein DnaC
MFKRSRFAGPFHQAETSVLFELISAGNERRSMLITANQPFGEWGGRSFPIPP